MRVSVSLYWIFQTRRADITGQIDVTALTMHEYIFFSPYACANLYCIQSYFVQRSQRNHNALCLWVHVPVHIFFQNKGGK